MFFVDVLVEPEGENDSRLISPAQHLSNGASSVSTFL
jgi:hypothetical protein